MTLWQLEGTLTTEAPLHVGDGGVAPLAYSRVADAEIQTAAKTSNRRARIPGAGLKGALRAIAQETDPLFKELFGYQHDDSGSGGAAAFLDATTAMPLEWSELGLGRTAIDPITGAAEENKLFHLEVVPTGTEFAVRIRGRSPQAEHIARAEYLNSLLGRVGPLGSAKANGWGRVAWSKPVIKVLDPGAWLAASPQSVDSFFDGIPSAPLTKRPAPSNADGRITIPLTLSIEYSFLVNDPQRAGAVRDRLNSHAARRTSAGELLLPAESFRGAFQHQAARIARTKAKSEKARQFSRLEDGSLPQDADSLTRLFGSAGWSSVLEISDFVEKTVFDNSKIQQLLAIDRFTGGGAEERKFTAEGGWRPTLSGKIVVDVVRLNRLGNHHACLGLLALTLRDLAEGDISFGWGSSKGYGWARLDTKGQEPRLWIEQQLARLDNNGTARQWIAAWESEA
jgi:CRISPR/Cas system CSM-associated protein Csm3 (group 7 of RAMP superfamily)